MAAPFLHLDTEAIIDHANRVDDAAEKLAEVAAAASYLDHHDEVYGEFPTKLILPLLNLAQDDAVQELRAETDATSQLADILRAITVDLSLTDHEAAQVLSFREQGR